ncbi:MAG: isocitrate/isopropylmalate dehydrogenase family protein [Thaumarchaeota archaeon]|nr:isocitrate/isopropylmalate dehydrogenase family protein [Nitrososphaerota archaeon]
MYKISLITGDGIGPELSESVVSVLNTIHDKLDVKFNIEKLLAGDIALKQYGKALPDQTLDAIKKSDVCMKAPVGESAADVIVVLRRMLDLYANIRPAKSYPGMNALKDGIDRIISEKASAKIAKYAFETARQRNGKKRVTCVHKSNVMRKTDGLFSRVCSEIAKSYSDVQFDQMYVDACAMNLIRRPETFDVIVTTNLFGDILSDESSEVVGGLGMAPAANIGDNFALFEPVHGAAFDIAGKGIANPSSFILSAKMMLEWLGKKHNDSKCFDIAKKLESAVYGVVNKGIKTQDIGGTKTTSEFTKEIVSLL